MPRLDPARPVRFRYEGREIDGYATFWQPELQRVGVAWTDGPGLSHVGTVDLADVVLP